MAKANGNPHVIYGDPADGIARNFIPPIWGVNLTDQQGYFNSAMRKVRISVEWVLERLFSILDT